MLHTQTPLWSATGRVPAFHLAAPPWVRWWSRKSRLYSVWVPGSATQPVSLAPVDHLIRLCDSVRPAFSQVPPHSSKGSRCSCLVWGDHCPIAEGRDGAGPSSRYEDRVLQPLLHCAQERRWVETNLGSARPELGKLPFKRLTQKCICGCIRPRDWLAAIDLKDAYFLVPCSWFLNRLKRCLQGKNVLVRTDTL